MLRTRIILEYIIKNRDYWECKNKVAFSGSMDKSLNTMAINYKITDIFWQ